MKGILKLCYVNEPWAFFTEAELSEQWGDDWNDAPYEHNAGPPYEDVRRNGERVPVKIVKVAYDGDWRTPCDGHLNSPYSVEAINAGAVAWLRSPDYLLGPPTVIPAGTSLEEFRRLIAWRGGHVYEAQEAPPQ